MRIRADVLSVLADAHGDGNTIRLPYRLDGELYNHLAQVMRHAGGAWSRGKAAHVFAPGTDAAELLQTMVRTGRVPGPWDTGYFPTPNAVLERMLPLAALEHPGLRILEPSAGRGAIAAPLAAAGHLVDCVELDDAHAEVLRASSFCVRTADFLTLDAEPVYDRVLMNPPFARQAFVRHTLHAHRFLAPGGRLVAVLPKTVAERTDRLTRCLAGLIEATGGQVHPLPPGSFAASGTEAHTVLAVLPAA